MPNLGIDIGAENTKVAIIEDSTILTLATVPTGFDQLASAEAAIGLALERVGLNRDSIKRIRLTGVGRKAVSEITEDEVNEINAAAKGAYYFFNTARTVIDAGAEEVRAIRLDDGGKVREFAINEKCAAGAGTFTEAMAAALETSLEEFAKAALQSTKKIPMNAQCAIFAESEVVSLIHSGASRADISRAVHDGIAERISAVARRLGLEKDIVLIGGMGNNAGFVSALRRILNMDVLVPKNPEYASAIGAAISE